MPDPKPTRLGLELELEVPDLQNPYLEGEVNVGFIHDSGSEIRRPAFWDGEFGWKVRFSAPAAGKWDWTSSLGETGSFEVAQGRPLLGLSPGKRNFVWSDGEPFLPIADTAWALPFRATLAETELYARDREGKGFNAANLMTIQPDTRAEGPADRAALDGFGRAFADDHLGHLNELLPDYFQHHDAQISILLQHGIVPIHTPLFHGYGWKGLSVNGPIVPPDEAARFARYLLARYGAAPAIWQVGADGSGWEPTTRAMGLVFNQHDAYHQPVGIHYNPWQSNDAHLEEDWCEFHLCQTGHVGEIRPEIVAQMHSRQPTRAVANGEPTYEGMAGGTAGVGRWQHDQAWTSFVAGGTLGIWYGAASLWQWRREPETAWGDWCAGPFDWQGALAQEGSRYPGILGQIVSQYDFVDASPTIALARGRRGIAKPGSWILAYLENGGTVNVEAWEDGLPWVAYRTLDGSEFARGRLNLAEQDPHMGSRIVLPVGEPLAVVVGYPRQEARS